MHKAINQYVLLRVCQFLVFLMFAGLLSSCSSFLSTSTTQDYKLSSPSSQSSKKTNLSHVYKNKQTEEETLPYDPFYADNDIPIKKNKSNNRSISSQNSLESTQNVKNPPNHPCPDFFTTIQNLKIQVYSNSVQKIPSRSLIENKNSSFSCSVYISPPNLPNKYRTYVLGRSGTIMIFVSTIPGAGVKGTGSRVYSFFPRNQIPFVEINSDKVIAHTATKGVELHFDTKNYKIKNSLGFEVITLSKINLENNGGVEFKNPKFLMIDYGFRERNDPTLKKDGKALITDSFKSECVVNNNEILTYASGVKGQDVAFKFSDLQFKDFLSKRCPQIKVEF